MGRFQKLTHTIYECKYHIVFCPKYRYRILQGETASYCRQQVDNLINRKESIELLELNIQADHIHMVLSVAPKYAISTMMGYLKGKLALRLFDRFESLGKRYWGRHLWSRGYCVSTVGLNEEEIRRYVKWQEDRDRQIEQSQLGCPNLS